MSTHIDPHAQFLIDHEQSKLAWMDNGPRKKQAEHMIMTRILSMPWQDMLDLYAKTQFEDNHGRIRVIQFVKRDPDTGEIFSTRYHMEQNIRGYWEKLPITVVEEE